MLFDQRKRDENEKIEAIDRELKEAFDEAPILQALNAWLKAREWYYQQTQPGTGIWRVKAGEAYLKATRRLVELLKNPISWFS